MEIVISLVVVFIAFFLGRILPHDRPLGDLRIDRSDPSDEPLMFLELDTDVSYVMRKKQVTFRIKLENFIPHE